MEPGRVWDQPERARTDPNDGKAEIFTLANYADMLEENDTLWYDKIQTDKSHSRRIKTWMKRIG